MAQQQSSSGFFAGAITLLGLGIVWVTVAGNFPSQEELFSDSLPAGIRQAARLSSSLSVPPSLDFTVPISPPLPSTAAVPSRQGDQSHHPGSAAPVVTRLNSRALQAASLKCEADIEQLCPDSPDGSTRMRCLQQRAHELPPRCQNLVREQFVKWKEGQSRLIEACNEDIERFCRVVKPGRGQTFQCLESHRQEVSDRCYQAFPKGASVFK